MSPYPYSIDNLRQVLKELNVTGKMNREWMQSFVEMMPRPSFIRPITSNFIQVRGYIEEKMIRFEINKVLI